MATQCDADAAQSYIGQDASEATVAEAKAAARATGALRVIKPGQPVTMDFRADRLTVEVDDANALDPIPCRRPGTPTSTQRTAAIPPHPSLSGGVLSVTDPGPHTVRCNTPHTRAD